MLVNKIAESILVRQLKPGRFRALVSGFHTEIASFEKGADFYKKLKGTPVSAHLASFSDIMPREWTPPYVHHLYMSPEYNVFLAALETGNVLLYKDLSLKRPLLCIEGHHHRVIHSELFSFRDSLILTASEDKTFALWDRGTADLKVKVSLANAPNTCSSTALGKILVGDTTSDISIFSFK